MSAENSGQIHLTLEDDGEVMIAAAGVVAYLRESAEDYGSGRRGGTPEMQKGAQDALTWVANALESECIAVGADALTETWWRS